MNIFTLIIIIFMVVLGQLFLINNSFNFMKLENFSAQENSIPEQCPNMLIKEDNKYYLYNTKIKEIPGVNPLIFNNLEEYVDFLKLEKSKNIKCPILFLQQTYDTQGKPSFVIRPSPTELNGGLPHDTFNNYAINRGNNSTVSQTLNMPISTSKIVSGGGPVVGLGETPSVNTIENSDISLPLPDVQPRIIDLNDASRDPPYIKNNNYPGFDPTNQYIGVITPLDKMFNESGVSPNPMDTNWGGPEVTDKFVAERYRMDPHNQTIIK
jgi:hypothetical protein